MMAMSYTCRAKQLKPLEVQEFAFHLINSNLQIEPSNLALWMLWNGTPAKDSLSTSIPKEQEVLQLLVKAGAHISNEDDHASCIVQQALEQEDSIRTLLDNGASVNQSDSSGRTLLANAAYSGNLDVVNLLISRGKMQSLTIKSSSSGSTGTGDVQPLGRGLSNGPVHAFSSPSESPDSTVDRQKSSLSNNSLKSSKNSSLRTTSSTSTAQTVPIDSFHGLSFTEQIQQHSLPRSRSRQSIVSPTSTTKSIGPQPGSPTSEFDWSQVKPGLKSSKGGNGTNYCTRKEGSGDKKKSKNSSAHSRGQVLEYEMTQFDRRVALNKPVSNFAVKDAHCKIVLGSSNTLESSHSQETYYIQQQSCAEKKRNGIMTNPNYHLQGNQVYLGRVSVPRTVHNRRHPEVLDNYPLGESELSLKQALKLQIEGSDPGFNYKKETPL
ncbi:Ankyrin repeat domain-containing protein 50 [Bagarius yarrelli]|uniref:Ankyrin repeat domain-containing protein 50 n=1 Tax=Bagarius yarrelli TaxID=175774 RepID=A0A556TVJ9_BAGYA|nr:Ankyrin repeat domain-containing protein 50 [Bagarius yarrelli]